MAAFTFTSSGACILNAGTNINTSIENTKTMNQWSLGVEDTLCDIMGFDAISKFTSLTENGRKILQELEDNMIAQKIIRFEPSAIGLSEATVRANMLENEIVRLIALLKESKVAKDYLGAT